jgi:hypothetical protein
MESMFMALESDVPPTVGAQLAHAEWRLADAGLSAPREDALTLLSRVLGVSPSMLRAGSECRLSPSAVMTYADWIKQRATRIAIPHITGHLAFMDLDLVVSPTTPLPPTYAPRLVEVALDCARGIRTYDLVAAEIGTGCGAIALALAAFEPRFARIFAVDSSPEALRAAVANGVRYLLNLVVAWLDGDGLDAIPEPVDLLVRARCEHPGSPAFTEVAERASVALRSGGALVCGVACGHEDAAADQLSRTLPRAHLWTQKECDGAIIVAQLPRSSMRDAAFESRR